MSRAVKDYESASSDFVYEYEKLEQERDELLDRVETLESEIESLTNDLIDARIQLSELEKERGN